jgi:hypothetical protein
MPAAAVVDHQIGKAWHVRVEDTVSGKLDVEQVQNVVAQVEIKADPERSVSRHRVNR